MWENKEVTVEIPIVDELIATTLMNRRDRFIEELMKPLPSVYSEIPTQKLTWRQRISRNLERVRDAWLVLTGKADIDGGW